MSDIDFKFITAILPSFNGNERICHSSSLHVLPLQIDGSLEKRSHVV